MTFKPPKRRGILLGSVILLSMLGLGGYGLVRLTRAEISPMLLLWVLLPLITLPLAFMVGYRLYGLVTGQYHLTRDGLAVQWGLAREGIPHSQVAGIELLQGEGTGIKPRGGFWWPGCVVGSRDLPGGERLEFFATTTLPSAAVLVKVNQQADLVLSPADPQAFLQAFIEATRLGTLEEIERVHQRPNFLLTLVWQDPWARGLILAGILVVFFMMGYLLWQASGIPTQVPLGFDPYGQPEVYGPAGRLLLLVLSGALIWLLNSVLGVWFYRSQGNRALAYVLWGTTLISAALLWAALVQLLTAANLS